MLIKDLKFVHHFFVFIDMYHNKIKTKKAIIICIELVNFLNSVRLKIKL